MRLHRDGFRHIVAYSREISQMALLLFCMKKLYVKCSDGHLYVFVRLLLFHATTIQPIRLRFKLFIDYRLDLIIEYFYLR